MFFEKSNFNPRSREGSDAADGTDQALANLISIHAPAKGATGLPGIPVASDGFQSTLPRRERREPNIYSRIYLCYFNPRSREGSDLGIWCDFEYDTEISIHAPAKGATNR